VSAKAFLVDHLGSVVIGCTTSALSLCEEYSLSLCMLVRQNEQHARLAYLLGKWRTDGAARWRQMVSRRRTLPLCDEIASPRFVSQI
jgi:hypothetical protein